MSNSYGSSLKLTIFGQSHAPAIGMTLENFPVGFTPDFPALQAFMARRAPGQGAYATARREADLPEFLSGLVDGHTCGAPLTAIIRNNDQHSKDYSSMLETPRPAHADYPAHVKFRGCEDVRGGGAFSGRLTAPLCIAGGLCLQYLNSLGIQVGAHILQIGGVRDASFDPVEPQLPVPAGTLSVLDSGKEAPMLAEIAAARADRDSVGGIIECAVIGLPAALGEPMFGGMENRLAQILFGIPAVKGVEFGAGFACASLRGSQNNDPYYYNNEEIRTRTNHAGGILGGLTNGMPLIFRLAIKPTPSIARKQDSIRYHGGNTQLEIVGRHDPCIVPRAVPCVEAAAAVAVLDAILEAKQWI